MTFTRGDLFADPSLRAYAHGCNCAGSMGAGIAVEFKRRWPRMFDEYRLRCEDGRFGLGDVFVWSADDATIYNLGTQAHWRKKAQLSAVSKALATMVWRARETGVARRGQPRIAPGRRGRATRRSPVRFAFYSGALPRLFALVLLASRGPMIHVSNRRVAGLSAEPDPGPAVAI